MPLFIRANIFPVDMLFYKAISTLMYDIHCKFKLHLQTIAFYLTMILSIPITLDQRKWAIFMRNFQGDYNRVNPSSGWM